MTLKDTTRTVLLVAVAVLIAGSAAFLTRDAPAVYDILIRNGTIYDGSGGAPYVGEVAIQHDRIAYVGPHAPGTAMRVIDATGKAVSPASSTCCPGRTSRSWSTAAGRAICARA